MATREYEFQEGDVLRPTAEALRTFPELYRDSRGVVQKRSVRTPIGQVRLVVTTFGRSTMARHWDTRWWRLAERPNKTQPTTRRK